MKIKNIFILLLIGLCSGFSWDAKADDAYWLDSMDLSGDLRYRIESVDQEYEVARHSHSLSARLNFVGYVSNDLNIVLGLGTGSNDDPSSEDQTLGGGFSAKPIWLNLAYFNYSPVDWGSLNAGKMENPFKFVGDNELVWDSDLNPEGLALKFEPQFENVSPFVRGAFFWAEEREDDRDTILIGSEFGLKVFTKSFYVLAGGRYIHFNNMKGHQVLLDSRNSFGNAARADSDGELYYLNGYKLLGEFFELGGKVSNVKWKLFADYVDNTEVNFDNKAWLVGASLGECNRALDICTRYSYRNVEKNSVVGAFSDYDFAGGVTGSKGHEVNVGTNLSDYVGTQVSYFNNEFGDLQVSYQKVQIDFSARF